MPNSPTQLIDQLKPIFQERLLVPTDAGYEKAKVIFYGGMDKHPAVIVQPKTANEVAQVIKAVKASGLELAIRSGGHSVAGHSSSEGGVVLDLRLMKNLEIDAAAQTAWVEPGMTAGEYSAEVGKQNLVTGFGDTGSVGIGGITLGGGIGFLVRKFGLAIDNLLAAEIVTADGQVLKVDDQNHPDLFWAIRGGGGNFGVVTKLQFKLYPLAQVIGGMMILPPEPHVVAGFIREAANAPEELSTILNVMPCPPMPFLPAELHGKMIAMALVMYAGDPAEGEKVVAPLRALAKPIADMIKPMKYFEMFPPEGGEYHPTAVSHTMFMKTVDEALATTIIKTLTESDASMRVVQLRVLGGAMARVPVAATAFAHRQSPIMANVAAFYQGAADRPQRLVWVKTFADQLNQGDPGAYVGFLSGDETDRLQDAYPAATLQKLIEVKKKYDPDNFFKLNHNISPS